MRNRERYRAAFGHIHAPEGAAERAGRALESRPKRRRAPLRTALIAAAVFALLAGAAGAELSAGAVSNLLAPLYGAARTELVDAVGCPVGASVSVNGYTLTAEAVVGDRYNIAVVYTLTRDDGQPIPEGAHFHYWDSNALDLTLFGAGGGSGSITTGPDETHSNCLSIVEHWESSSAMLWRGYEVTARDLVVFDLETESYQTIAEGEWTLKFTLRYEDATVTLPVNGLTVTGTEGREYTLQNLELSPVGVHIDLLAPNEPHSVDNPPGPGWPLPDFEGNYLRLSDGTTVDLNHNRSMGGGGSEDAPTIKASYGVFFDQPIDLSEVEAVVLCGTEIPVNLT